MGQNTSAPPEAQQMPSDNFRQNYLRKLGVAGAKKTDPTAISKVMTKTLEAPERLEHPEEDPGQHQFSMAFIEPKSHDDLRLAYLRKLSYTKVWQPASQRPKTHQSVIIFDWDDTLLCTSYLNLRQEEVPPSVQTQLRALEESIINLLKLALTLGNTFLITNAMPGWVEYSANKWVPAILPILSKLKVISARGAYEQRFPGNYHEWKVQAFLEVQRSLNSELITNLVCLGDSNIEMDAIHVMGKCFSQALVKTVKFRENPTPDELVKQLQLVAQKFDKICNSARNLTIRLERKWVPTANTPGAPQRANDV